MPDAGFATGNWMPVLAAGALHILVILAAAFIATRIMVSLVHRLERLADDNDPDSLSEREKRAQTLGMIVRRGGTAAIWLVAGSMLLGELGVDIHPLLAGAGIAGVALGFGAQTLVRDVIAGFFILLENQIRVGDVVQAGGVGGLVEAITLRTTVLRDIEGRVHVVPNGSVDVVTNFTRGWSRALLDVGVAYKEDTDRCFRVLREVAHDMEADPEFGPRLGGSFEFPGIEDLGDSAVVLRMMVATQPQERWNVLRELRRRVKQAFDRHGIEIPFPHHTVYFGGAPPTPSTAAAGDDAFAMQRRPGAKEGLSG
jgi:moderate conductance mechanosensitive channel